MRKYPLVYAFFIWTVTLSGQLYAETLTLDECVQEALNHNRDIILSINDILDAAADRAKARSDFYPHLSLDSSYAKAKVEHSGDLPSDDKWRDSSGYSLNLKQALFYGGLYTKNRLADIRERGAKFRSHAVKELIIDNVLSKFLDIHSLVEVKKVLTESRKIAREQTRLAKAKFDLGMASETDYLKSTVEEGRYMIELVGIDGQIKSGLAELNMIMGRLPESELKLSPEDEQEIFIPDFNTASALVKQNNSELKTYENSWQAAKIELQISKERLLPGIDIKASHSKTRSEIENEKRTETDNRIGVYFNIDLFSGYSKKTEIKKSTVARAKARTEYLKKQDELIENLSDTYTRLDTLTKSLKIYNKNLISAEKESALAKQLYELGKVTILDMIDANHALISSRSKIIQIKNDIKKNKSRIRLLTGGYSD